jgi:hypothetical protein
MLPSLRVLLCTATAALVMIAPPAFRLSAGATATAQDQDPAPAFLSTFSGGAVEGKRARTQTTPQAFLPSAGFVNVTGATLAWFVTPGDSDLFNVSFSAVCRKSGGGALLIRVLDNFAAAMEPYDGGQVFCSSTLATPTVATFKGNWVRRSGGALLGTNHTLQVQVQDDGPAPGRACAVCVFYGASGVLIA